MKICVYGAGAVGGLIAGRLARSGHEVSVVARGAHLEAIRARGLRVRDGPSGVVEPQAVRAEADPALLGPQDYVIVAVKAQNLPEVAAGSCASRRSTRAAGWRGPCRPSAS